MNKIYALAALAAACVAPALSAADYTAIPKQGYVESLNIVQVKFPGAQIALVEGCEINTVTDYNDFNRPLNPRYESEYTLDNGRTELYALDAYKVVDGNTLYLERGFDLNSMVQIVGGDWIDILINGASYTINGQPGEDITLHYTFVYEPETGEMTVVPSVEDKVAGLNKIEVSFYDTAVDMAEGAETDFMAGVTGQSDLQVTYTTEKDATPQLFSNYVFKAENDVLVAERYAELTYENTAESNYVTVTIPAGSYLAEGEEGEEVVLTYFFDPYSGVKALFGEETKLTIYDMQGRQIEKDVDAAVVKTLKGMYVVNGKKVVF